MSEIPLMLQLVSLLVAVSAGVTLPFVLFILADMRSRLLSLEELVRMNSTHTATHAAQLAYISQSINREKRDDSQPGGF